jgi:hypothetical protein
MSRLSARMERLDGGGTALRRQELRADWWEWRDRSQREWPDHVADAFRRSGDAGDPECKRIIESLSEADLNWLIVRLLKKAGVWTEAMEAALPEMPPHQELVALANAL